MKIQKGDKVAIVSLSSGILGEEFIKHELDIALLHKMKFNEELAKKKINKLDDINGTIKDTINIFNNFRI